MSFTNPSDSTEILYGASGDVRDEFNAHMEVTTAGHYADESELAGSLIIRSLRRATRLINAYLEPVYADQIPFAVAGDVPKLLEQVSTDIATYYVFRSLSAKVGPVPDDKKAQYYGDHVEEKDGTLPKLRDRKLQLPELTAQYTDEVKTVRKQGRAPVFDMDSPFNHEVDQDLLDDIEQERDR